MTQHPRRRTFVATIGEGKLYYEHDLKPLSIDYFEDRFDWTRSAKPRSILYVDGQGEIRAAGLGELEVALNQRGVSLRNWVLKNPRDFSSLLAGHINKGLAVDSVEQGGLREKYGLQIEKCLPRTEGELFLCTLYEPLPEDETEACIDVTVSLTDFSYKCKPSEFVDRSGIVKYKYTPSERVDDLADI